MTFMKVGGYKNDFYEGGGYKNDFYEWGGYKNIPALLDAENVFLWSNSTKTRKPSQILVYQRNWVDEWQSGAVIVNFRVCDATYPVITFFQIKYYSNVLFFLKITFMTLQRTLSELRTRFELGDAVVVKVGWISRKSQILERRISQADARFEKNWNCADPIFQFYISNTVLN